jgi:hypothetical protein
MGVEIILRDLAALSGSRSWSCSGGFCFAVVSLSFYALRREKIKGAFLLPFLAVGAGAESTFLSIFL